MVYIDDLMASRRKEIDKLYYEIESLRDKLYQSWTEADLDRAFYEEVFCKDIKTEELLEKVNRQLPQYEKWEDLTVGERKSIVTEALQRHYGRDWNSLTKDNLAIMKALVAYINYLADIIDELEIGLENTSLKLDSWTNPTDEGVMF